MIICVSIFGYCHSIAYVDQACSLVASFPGAVPQLPKAHRPHNTTNLSARQKCLRCLGIRTLSKLHSWPHPHSHDGYVMRQLFSLPIIEALRMDPVHVFTGHELRDAVRQRASVWWTPQALIYSFFSTSSSHGISHCALLPGDD